MKDRAIRFLLMLLPVVFSYLLGCIVNELLGAGHAG